MFGYWKQQYLKACKVIETRDATIVGLEMERDGAYAQAKELAAQIRAVHAQLTTVREDKAELEIQNASLDKELLKTVNVLAQEEKRASDLYTKNGILEDENDALNSELNEMNDKLTQLEVELKDTDRVLKDSQEQCEKLAAQTRSFIEANNWLETRVVTLEKTISTFSEIKGQLLNEIDLLKKSVLAWTDKYSALHASHENELDNIKAAVNLLLDVVDGQKILDHEILVTRSGQLAYAEKKSEISQDFPLK